MNAAIVLCIFGWCAVLKNSISSQMQQVTPSSLIKVQGRKLQTTVMVTIAEQSLESTYIRMSTPGGVGQGVPVSAGADTGSTKKSKSKRIISASFTRSKLVVPEDMRKYLPKTFRHKQCFFSYDDREADLCSFCRHFNMTTVSIYVESFDLINQMYFGLFSQYEAEAASCKLPNGARCLIQHHDTESDAVMKDAAALGLAVLPTRYCYPQVLILMNAAGRRKVYGYKMYADITVDESLSSTIFFGSTCHLMDQLFEKMNQQPPDPFLHSGAVMFIDHCSSSYRGRTEWIKALLKVMSIDSFGKCMQNKAVPPSADGNWKHDVAVHYRFVIIHEPFNNPDHVTARIFHAFLAGAIPVYRGSRAVYDRIPGNHSIIYADDFSTPLELATYLMKVETDDELFLYHTKLNFTLLKQFVAKHCRDWQTPVACKLCSNVYSHKLATFQGGGRPCNCRNQPPRMIEDRD